MTREELETEIARRRARVALLIEETRAHQAIVQRLMVERGVMEGELRGLEEAARVLRIVRRPGRPRKPANDD